MNKPASQDAFVYATVAVASIQLRLGDYDEARKKLDECEKILDGFDSVETVVHASFYRANAEYYKVRKPLCTLPHVLTSCSPSTSSPLTTKTLSSSSRA